MFITTDDKSKRDAAWNKKIDKIQRCCHAIAVTILILTVFVYFPGIVGGIDIGRISSSEVLPYVLGGFGSIGFSGLLAMM